MALASSGEGGSAAEEASLSVKYLSSARLMRLQLQDGAARRHFLLQACAVPSLDPPPPDQGHDRGGERALVPAPDARACPAA